MRKWIIIILVFVLFSFFFCKWFFKHPCQPPEKPDTVPQTAVWKGGCDGGEWIEFVSTEKEYLRFKIYRDWDGELILDSYFKHSECGEFKITQSNWEKHVAYFGINLMIYHADSIPQRCMLIPIDYK